jgi:Zn-finger nucleic acid-binding protein
MSDTQSTNAQLACPSCDKKLEHYFALGIALDGCKSGCGGIWFDTGELSKFEDLKESPPFEILKLKKFSEVAIDRGKVRKCPRCINRPLQTRLMEQTLGIEVDTCMSCAGNWLDLGELKTIRDDRVEIEKMDQALAELELKAKLGEASWPRGLRAVLKLIFR